MAIASREIIAVPDRFDSTSFTYSYYSRFMLLDSNSTVLFEKNLRIDTNKYSRFVPEYILLDDSLNLYFIASYNDRLQWYLGKITAAGGIVNPLSHFSVPASQRHGLELYPNPFSDELQLVTTARGDHHLKLYSLSGKLVLETQLTAKNQAKLNTAKLEPGLYIYQVQNVESGEIQRGKILKR